MRATPQRPDVLVVDAFTRQVAITPDAPAVRHRGRVLSYAELDQRSQLLAASLRGRGIGRGHLVAVLLDRSADLIITLLAVLRAGAAYVPLSPDDPPERVRHLLNDAHPSLLVAPMRRSEWADIPMMTTEDAAAGSVSAVAAGGPVGIMWSDAAYVIYTSGSTGRPKGVVIEHGALAAYLRHVIEVYPSVAGRTILHTSVSYDMAVTSVYGPLLTGGVIEIADLLLVEAAEASAVPAPTFLKVTPSHLPLLTALPSWSSPTAHLVVGGEALSAAQLASWWSDPAVLVTNEYGPTEATVGCCVHTMSRSDDPGGALVPIGWPTRASRLYVLDEQLRPVPEGTAGELYIAGEQLARGYLGRPAATAASFVPDPFGPPGQRMYRSGDLVRMRSDGCLEYLGRIDEQIKVNGYRVEPAEIEAALAEHPLVGQAVVRLASAPDALARRLTAFIVPAEPSGLHAVDPEALRHHTAARLPKHMVPVDYFTVPKIPLTGNGKVDLDLLTSQACTAPDLVAATTAPHERLLCDLIAQLTGAARVEVDDDFFQLGGTSVTAAQLVTLARREGVTITLGGVLKKRTVRRLLAGRPSPGG